MLPEIEQLLVLQDRDRKIRALKKELKLAPAERKEWESRLTGAQTQLEAVKLKARETEVERKKLEIEAQAKRDQIAKYQLQKFQTRKNEEFQALSNEIQRFEDEVKKIEDRELELMEGAEQLRETIAKAEKDAGEVRARAHNQLNGLQVKLASIEDQLAQLETERGTLAGNIDEDLLDTYNHLTTTKGDNAVVALEHEVCTGCHMKVTVATAAEVRARRGVVHCEQCGRILYYES
ncbi:MAG: C4-type zinc ribbon domain-containing protein [Verrucomicrobiota bacterium]|nr:C4-type zinc ribbon domain-containing protein [Verrucomicrobiota bacterium]